MAAEAIFFQFVRTSLFGAWERPRLGGGLLRHGRWRSHLRSRGGRGWCRCLCRDRSRCEYRRWRRLRCLPVDLRRGRSLLIGGRRCGPAQRIRPAAPDRHFIRSRRITRGFLRRRGCPDRRSSFRHRRLRRLGNGRGRGSLYGSGLALLKRRRGRRLHGSRRRGTANLRLAIEPRIGHRLAIPEHGHEGGHEHGCKGRVPRHAGMRFPATEPSAPPRRGSHRHRCGNGRQVVRHLPDGVASARIGHGAAVRRMVQRTAQYRVMQRTVAVEIAAVLAAAAHARCSSTDR